jgi:hypothetical protein
MDAVGLQHGVDLVGHSLDQGAQEVGRDAVGGFRVQLSEANLNVRSMATKR